MRVLLFSAVLAVIGTVAACSLSDQKAPPLAGPSELGLSLAVSAIPDSILQDGGSQSLVTIVARSANAQPVANLSLRAEIAVGGFLLDFGSLSAKTVVTGSDGRATLVYTAPPAPVDSVDTFTLVTIRVTPIDGDYANAFSRTVQIRLVPPGVILRPNTPPVPRFTYSPVTPLIESAVLFDASTSTDADGAIVKYAWQFGDGNSAEGVQATHSYTRAAVFTAILTVTDDRGFTASTSQSVSVVPSGPPIAFFTFSPTSPAVGQTVYFSAASSSPSTGRVLVGYDWTFGDGGTAGGVNVSHAYSAAGDYSVTLTVTDDAGNFSATSQDVTVGSGGATGTFTVSPTNPTTAIDALFNASGITAASGRTIVQYDWNFGDAASASNTFSSTSPTATHRFSAARTYTVTLTVTDSANVKTTFTKEVTVT